MDGPSSTVAEPNSSGNRIVYTVTNTDTLSHTYFFSSDCTGHATCTGVTPSSATIGAGSDAPFTATFNVGTPVSGTVVGGVIGGDSVVTTLAAEPGEGFVTAVTTPYDSTGITVAPNTTYPIPHGTFFVYVTNVGTATGTAGLTCSATGPVICEPFGVDSMTLGPGESNKTTIGFQTGGPGVGYLTLGSAPGGGRDMLKVTVQ